MLQGAGIRGLLIFVTSFKSSVCAFSMTDIAHIFHEQPSM
jgi:hypothetical protein